MWFGVVRSGFETCLFGDIQPSFIEQLLYAKEYEGIKRTKMNKNVLKFKIITY